MAVMKQMETCPQLEKKNAASGQITNIKVINPNNHPKKSETVIINHVVKS